MILTGSKIQQEVKQGKIVIAPFDGSCVNPNSYNYHLADELIHVTKLDLKYNQIIYSEKIQISAEGFVIQPGELYLGSTVEVIGSPYYTTSLIGRSSIGRLGLFLQVSANLGHQTIHHRWTLEMRACIPVRVYPMQVIGQVSFWITEGQTKPYDGLYAKYDEPKASEGVEF